MKNRTENHRVLYPVHLIDLAESSSKPVVKEAAPKEVKPVPPPKPKQEPKPKPEPKPEPKAVKKFEPPEPPEPKKGVPVEKKKEEKKKEEKDVAKKEIEKKPQAKNADPVENDAKKVDRAIEEIKKTLAKKEETERPLLSEDFVERQKQFYAAKIDEKIKANWSIPKALLTEMGVLEAIVILRIKPDGELDDIRLIKPSGFNKFDESAIRAIKKAAPFPHPPMDWKNVEFEIRFYSNEMV
ncbi:TonB C-terminal domain-containing protein [bacterium]|nr:TonB C-terminal domain-containing protein [bacterium]